MSTIKAGDVVMLKSGGPPMTVCTVIRDAIDVRWFDGFVLKTAILVPIKLVKLVDDEPEPQEIDAEEMDDFIRAVMADNNPRSDEPFATVAKWIRKLHRSDKRADIPVSQNDSAKS